MGGAISNISRGPVYPTYIGDCTKTNIYRGLEDPTYMRGGIMEFVLYPTCIETRKFNIYVGLH